MGRIMQCAAVRQEVFVDKLALTLLIILTTLGSALAADKPDDTPRQDPDFILGPGDVLEISVWQEPELSRIIRIRPDGKLSYPFVGEVKASGRTVEEVRQVLEQKIQAYVPGAPVALILQDLFSQRFYIIGRVRSPGVFPIYEPIRVMQALSMAGGLDEFASDDIYVIRESAEGQTVLRFDYSDLKKGKDLKQNFFLQTKDTIIVR